MTTLVAFDPGLRYPAVAIFHNGKLIHASRVKLDPATTSTKLPTGQRCLAVAKQVSNYFYGIVATHPAMQATDVLVTEWPKVYRAGKSKGDPADLMPLAAIGIGLAAILKPRQVESPTAAEWIGGLPKATTGDPLMSPRGIRIWSRLDDGEKANVVVSHDSLDSVGIGLHYLGRLERRRVFPGATL